MMGTFYKRLDINGLPNSHFFVTVEGIVTTSLAQAEKFSMKNIMEVSAPVWQLCDSRHENKIANMGGIFPKCLANPMDMYGMKQAVIQKIAAYYMFGDTLFCVVTGMSSALVALINACEQLEVELKLLHFDIVHDCYQVQSVDNTWLSEKRGLYERVLKR